MDREEKKWRSPSLGKDMALKIYGNSGTPVIAFPTSGQHIGQWEKHGMIDALNTQIESGFNQIYCVDTVDSESILNTNGDARKRLMRYRQYESYVMEEVVPFIMQQNSSDYLMIVGVDLGGYHALNFALKHPNDFDRAIGISGIYDIRQFFGDFYNNDLYYNNPLDFMPNMNNQSLLNTIRNLEFRLVSYENDSRKNDACRLAHVFRKKSIDPHLDIWQTAAADEWEIWQQMLKIHIV